MPRRATKKVGSPPVRRSYTPKSGRRYYASRSQRIDAKRARRALRAKLVTPAQEATKVAFQARTLERGLENMRGDSNDQKSE